MSRRKKENLEARLRESQELVQELRRELDVHKRVDLVAHVNMGKVSIYDRVTRKPLRNSLLGDVVLLPELFTAFGMGDRPARVRITIECDIEDYDWGEDEQ